MNNITEIKCIDGKYHRWVKPNEDSTDGKSYCKKCNSTTLHAFDGRRKNPWIRCKDIKGNYTFEKGI